MDAKVRVRQYLKAISLINLMVFVTLLLSTGVHTAWSVLMRAMIFSLVVGVLLWKFSLSEILCGLRYVKCPQVLVEVFQFTLRYIFLYQRKLKTKLTAVRLKGVRRPSVRSVAPVVTHLLIESYEQSERVHQAMVMRGQGQ